MNVERRGFFARMAGALAGLFGIPLSPGAFANASTIDSRRATGHLITVDVCGGGVASNLLPSIETPGVSQTEAFLIGIEAGILQQHLAHNPAQFKTHVPTRCLEQFSSFCETYGRKPKVVCCRSARTEIIIPAANSDRDAIEGYYDGFAEILRAT